MRIKSAEDTIPILAACKVHFFSEIDVEICFSKTVSLWEGSQHHYPNGSVRKIRWGFKDVIVLMLLLSVF